MDLEALKAVIKDENRVVFADIPEEYLSDTLGRLKGTASALVFVKSTEEVSGILSYAYKNRIPVTPRGAGTNLVGSTVPVDGGIILDFSQMNGILELDTETITVTVEPGILLQDLQRFVEEKGLFYPPDPGEKASTIGGNISTNAGGMRAVKYGVTRDYVRGLEVVTADGTVLTVGGKNVKDATAEFISFINQLDKESGMQMVSFGHAGDGNVHLCVVRGSRDEQSWKRELYANMDKAYAKAYELGGVTSGEHGIGISKRRYFLRETHKENLAVMNSVKNALDPLHILNDKKSYIIGGNNEEII